MAMTSIGRSIGWSTRQGSGMMEAGPSRDRPRGLGTSSEMHWIDGITDWLSHLGDNSARTMFGGHSLYWRGVIFAIAH